MRKSRLLEYLKKVFRTVDDALIFYVHLSILEQIQSTSLKYLKIEKNTMYSIFLLQKYYNKF